jgi:threonylcarbamoyladenosine tRNA methylthiotransferase MtaB
MIAENPLVPRVRLSSIDPPELTTRLLRLVAQSDVFCPHFHVPVQAGDDAVLVRMRRRYSAELAREALLAAREIVPDCGIGTDVIAGFPGESEVEFERTFEFLQAMPFTYLHVFPYSPRRGTTAAKRADKLPADVVAGRAERLRWFGKQKRMDFARSMIGRRTTVLLESERDATGKLSGYSPNYVRVRVDSLASAPNSLVEVEVLSCGEDGSVFAVVPRQ